MSLPLFAPTWAAASLDAPQGTSLPLFVRVPSGDVRSVQLRPDATLGDLRAAAAVAAGVPRRAAAAGLRFGGRPLRGDDRVPLSDVDVGLCVESVLTLATVPRPRPCGRYSARSAEGLPSVPVVVIATVGDRSVVMSQRSVEFAVRKGDDGATGIVPGARPRSPDGMDFSKWVWKVERGSPADEAGVGAGMTVGSIQHVHYSALRFFMWQVRLHREGVAQEKESTKTLHTSDNSVILQVIAAFVQWREPWAPVTDLAQAIGAAPRCFHLRTREGQALWRARTIDVEGGGPPAGEEETRAAFLNGSGRERTKAEFHALFGAAGDQWWDTVANTYGPGMPVQRAPTRRTEEGRREIAWRLGRR